MDDQPPNYRRNFFKSPHHAALGLVTLGSVCVLGPDLFPLSLVASATAYLLGWIYLPDMPLFQGWVNRRRASVRNAAALAEVGEFIRKRDALLDELSADRRNRYHALAAVCRDLEAAGSDQALSPGDPGGDPRLRKLDECMWTFLRLLSIEESLERFFETERREDVPRLLNEAEEEAARLSAEYDALKAKGGSASALDPKERLLSSRLERLDVLRKRVQRIEQAHSNLALVISEQERLDQQIKLMRADTIASKNADGITARIDATVSHLDQTNKWLSEMSEFKDSVGDLPESPVRVGYAPSPPPLPDRGGAQAMRQPLKMQVKK